MGPRVTSTLASAREIHASFSRALACTHYLVAELYRMSLIVRTSMCHFNVKGFQINEFVRINEFVQISELSDKICYLAS